MAWIEEPDRKVENYNCVDLNTVITLGTFPGESQISILSDASLTRRTQPHAGSHSFREWSVGWIGRCHWGGYSFTSPSICGNVIAKPSSLFLPLYIELTFPILMFFIPFCIHTFCSMTLQCSPTPCM